MVISDINLPPTINNYFDTDNSVFNPDNKNYHFYVYGNLPLLFTKSVATILKYDGYDKIYIIGRILSVIFDSSIIILVYLISREIFTHRLIPLLGSFVYAISVLPIQQAHFFTVDSCTVFFATLTMYILILFLRTKSISHLILSGFIFGLTISSKTSIIVTLPVLLLTISLAIFKKKLFIATNNFLFLLFAFIAFRLFQPYAFNGFYRLSPLFVQNIKLASEMITGVYDYPPNIQWTGTLPLIHPFMNIFFFGLGPTISLIVLIGIYMTIKNLSSKKIIVLFLISAYIAVIFCYQGIQWAKYMRYFYPIYPFLAIFAGNALFSIVILKKLFKVILILLILSWPLAFIGIYSRLHSRVQASYWIYDNLPIGSSITSESWDDTLPLDIPGHSFSSYRNTTLPLYDSDTISKWQSLNTIINSTDFMMLTSNRLWGSIPKAISRYPESSQFYQNLFQEKLSLKRLKTFISYPGFEMSFLRKCYLFGPTNYPGLATKWFLIDPFCANPGVYFRDDTAEESFTVYDHPQVIIFSKINK